MNLARLASDVRPVAINEAQIILSEAEALSRLPEPSDMAADGLGGLEVSWQWKQREVLFSVTASRKDLPPDAYLMLIDRKEKDRSTRYRTVRESIASEIIKGLEWMRQE